MLIQVVVVGLFLTLQMCHGGKSNSTIIPILIVGPSNDSMIDNAKERKDEHECFKCSSEKENDLSISDCLKSDPKATTICNLSWHSGRCMIWTRTYKIESDDGTMKQFRDDQKECGEQDMAFCYKKATGMEKVGDGDRACHRTNLTPEQLRIFIKCIDREYHTRSAGKKSRDGSEKYVNFSLELCYCKGFKCNTDYGAFNKSGDVGESRGGGGDGGDFVGGGDDHPNVSVSNNDAPFRVVGTIMMFVFIHLCAS